MLRYLPNNASSLSFDAILFTWYIGRLTLWWSRHKAILISWVGAALSVAWSIGAQLTDLLLFQILVVLIDAPGTSSRHNTISLMSPRLCFIIVRNLSFFFYREDSLTS